MEIKKVAQDVSSLLKMGALEKGKMEKDLFKRMLEGASSQYHDGPNALFLPPQGRKGFPRDRFLRRSLLMVCQV